MPLLLLLDGSGVEEQTRYITDTIVSQADLLRLLDSVKPPPDGVAGNDLGIRVGASITKTDTVRVSDPKTLSVSVPKTDQVGVLDPKSLTAANSGRDTVSLLDLRGAGVGRVGTVRVSDSRSIGPSIWKTDTGAFSDLRGAGVGRTDGVAASDQKSLRVENSRQDTASASDPRGAGIGLKADTVNVADLRAILPSVAKTDVVAGSETKGAGVGLKADTLKLLDLRSVLAGVSKPDTVPASDPRGAGIGLKADTLRGSDNLGAGIGLKADTVAIFDPRGAGIGLKADTVAIFDPRGAGIGLKADTIKIAEQRLVAGAIQKTDITKVSDPRGAGIGLKADTVKGLDSLGAGIGLKADTVKGSDNLGAGVLRSDRVTASEQKGIRVTDAHTDVTVMLDERTVGLLLTNVISALDKINLAVALQITPDIVKISETLTADQLFPGFPVENVSVTDIIAGGETLGAGVGLVNVLKAMDRAFIDAAVQMVDRAILGDPRLVLIGLKDSDTVAISDPRGAGIGLKADALRGSDTLGAGIGLKADTVKIAEQRGFGAGRTDTLRASDVRALSVTDSVTPDTVFAANLRQILASIVKQDDLVKIGDTVSSQQAWRKLVTDTVKASETFNAGVGLVNVVGVADLRRIMDAVATTSDQVAIGESESIAARLAHSEGAVAGQGPIGAGVGLTNTVKASDIITAVKNYLASVLDTLKLNDQTRQAISVILTQDTAVLSETLVASFTGGNSASVTDTVKMLDAVTLLVGAAIADTLKFSDKLLPGVGVSNTVVAREGTRTFGVGYTDRVTTADPRSVAANVSTAPDTVKSSDAKIVQPQPRLADSLAAGERLYQSLQQALQDTVRISDPKQLRLATATLADQLAAGSKLATQAQPQIVDRLVASDRLSQTILANLVDGVVLKQASIGLALAFVDTLTLSELHRQVSGLLVSDKVDLKDRSVLNIFETVTDRILIPDLALPVSDLRLVLQDALLSSDRMERSVSTLIQEAIHVLDEAVNDGIPGPPVLFLKFTEEVLRTHGFTRQALKVQKFVEQTLRSVSGRKDEEGL